MTDNLTYDDSLLESHYSKTCEASSYKEELSATSKLESQINTTEELSACLARLNALNAKIKQTADDVRLKAITLIAAAPDDIALALANKLHAENERLKALLVECEATLEVYQHSDEVLGNCNNGEAFNMRTKLHAAGIGK